MNNRSLQGFTLSELLVSLAVLGLIAAFAIPKVLTAVGNSSARAIGSELIATISQSYEALRADRNGSLARGTKAPDLVGKMNYRTLVGGVATFPNGGTITFNTADDFTDGTTGVIGFNVDPDGTGGQFGSASAYIANDGRFWLGYTDYGPSFAAGSAAVPAAGGKPAVAAVPAGTLSGWNTTYAIGSDSNNVASTPSIPSNANGSDNTWAS